MYYHIILFLRRIFRMMYYNMTFHHFVRNNQFWQRILWVRERKREKKKETDREREREREKEKICIFIMIKINEQICLRYSDLWSHHNCFYVKWKIANICTKFLFPILYRIYSTLTLCRFDVKLAEKQ